MEKCSQCINRVFEIILDNRRQFIFKNNKKICTTCAQNEAIIENISNNNRLCDILNGGGPYLTGLAARMHLANPEAVNQELREPRYATIDHTLEL